MMMLLYSVYDVKAKMFLPPFAVRAPGEATRLMTDIVNDPSSVFAKHPEDYSVSFVGQWDDADGMLHCLVAPEHVFSCSALKSA